MKKMLLLILIPSVCFSQQVTTYTLTPSSKAFSLISSGGQRWTRPLNSVYLEYSRDSQKVRIASVYDMQASLMGIQDSIIHFYTGSGLHFSSRTQFDSFYKASLNK